jgi:hypothetical protein
VTLTVDGVTYPRRAGNVGAVKAGKELTIGWDDTDFFRGTLDDLQIDIGRVERIRRYASRDLRSVECATLAGTCNAPREGRTCGTAGR